MRSRCSAYDGHPRRARPQACRGHDRLGGEGDRLANGLDEPAFRASDLHQAAITHCTSIVGEAAFKTSAGFRASHPQVPWRVIIGMRHKLIHDYGGVALRVVWLTVSEDLPDLIRLLRAMLPPDADTHQ